MILTEGRKWMTIQLFFKKCKWILLLILVCVFLVGCNANRNTKKINIYRVNYDTTINNYLPLSDIGDDCLIPKLDNKYWGDYQKVDKGIKKSESRDGSAVFYIIREDEKENLNTELMESNELVSLIKKKALPYIGTIEDIKSSINFQNDMKYTDYKGKVNSSCLYGTCFQSYCEIPSVKSGYVPTAYIVIFKETSDERNIMNMILTIKEWTLRIK